MKNTNHSVWGKLAYMAVFILVLPLLLVFWAGAVSVSLPAVQSPVGGALLAGFGAVLLLAGMYALWHFGKGLPMNAYPPPRLVVEGVYRLLPHPIYVGFGLLCFGVSLYTGSAAGLWLVSPVAVLGCVALVWGFEGPDLRRRFPERPREYWLLPPANGPEWPALHHRLATVLLLLLPWVLLNAAARAASSGEEITPLFLLPEDMAFSEPVQAGIALAALGWVMLAPFLAQSRQQLRQFFFAGTAGGAVVLYLAFVWPALGLSHWTATPGPWWWEALLSLSWFWVWPAALVFEEIRPAGRWYWRALAFLLTLGLLASSADPLAHAFSGGAGFLAALFYPLMWEFFREVAEKIANSWREWVFGPVRVINHGFYIGIASVGGVLMGILLAGPDYGVPIVVFGAITTVCAGLWGQFVEGSDKLKRPFGYYGGLFGLVLASLVMVLMRVDAWVVLAVFSVFMPWVQAIGRLRCLVNGCCHGAETTDRLGIRYVHPRSRVCFISGLKGKPLHPTPLYALLWLGLLGGVQLRLWLAGADLTLLFGLYLMGTGLGRFVEEAYRGEPQTPVWGKLRLYQWTALASVLAGIVVTFFPYAMPALQPGILDARAWALALSMAVFAQFLMGVDFPQSQRRFSRLT